MIELPTQRSGDPEIDSRQVLANGCWRDNARDTVLRLSSPADMGSRWKKRKRKKKKKVPDLVEVWILVAGRTNDADCCSDASRHVTT